MWARVAVGLVLLVAGASKLRDPGWPPSARRFGAHAWTVPVLPWVELVLGGLLVARVGGRWTAAAAAGLLAVFLVVVWRRVAAGDETPCACFGRASTAPMTVRTVARNAVLVGLAVVGALSR